MTPGKLKHKILIVDDDAVFCSVLKDGLKSCGYDCTTAASGDAAIALLKTVRFDLMITDVMMPGMNGFELSRLAKECCSTLSIVLMTGIPRDDFSQLAKGAIVPFYIEKPFNLDQLVLYLGAVIKSRQMPVAGTSQLKLRI